MLSSVPALKPPAFPPFPAQPAPFAARYSPSTLDRPAFLMGFPFSDPSRVADDPWVADRTPLEREQSLRRAYLQFVELFRHLSPAAHVYLLPTDFPSASRDPVLTGSLGVVLEHVPGRNVVVLSNFDSGTRRSGNGIGRGFFEATGYEAHVAPRRFEGEADLKHLHGHVYVGGYGIRSELECYDWMECMFDMRILKVALQDPSLDHLDCTFFPLTQEHALVCTSLFEPREIREIEQHVAIIDVTLDECYSGICNSIRLARTILNASHLNDLVWGTEGFELERAKNRRLEDIAAGLALDVRHFNLSECQIGGPLLSGMLMHLNRHSYHHLPAN